MPEMFYENIYFGSIFGSFPGMTWNGGSFYPGQVILIEAEKVVKLYEELSIPIKLTITNPSLTKEDCYDRYCNALLKLCDNGKNEVLISSKILENYIREKFPNIKINKSIIASQEDCDYIEELKIYNKIVLPRRVLQDFNFLNSLPNEARSKVELLCNDPCPPNCYRLYDHYKIYGDISLFKDYPNSPKADCIFFNTDEDFILKNHRFKESKITIDKIKTDYSPLGFTEYKISGRGHPNDIVFSIIPYLIKSEY